MPTFFVNEMALQVVNTEFLLTFFEVRFPIVHSTQVEGAPKEVLRPLCVARLAISAERIPDVLKILEGQFKSFKEQRDLMVQSSMEVQSDD